MASISATNATATALPPAPRNKRLAPLLPAARLHQRRARESSATCDSVQARDRFIHGDGLRLACLDSRESTLDLFTPSSFGVRIDFAIQARNELLCKLCTL